MNRAALGFWAWALASESWAPNPGTPGHQPRDRRGLAPGSLPWANRDARRLPGPQPVPREHWRLPSRVIRCTQRAGPSWGPLLLGHHLWDGSGVVHSKPSRLWRASIAARATDPASTVTGTPPVRKTRKPSIPGCLPSFWCLGRLRRPPRLPAAVAPRPSVRPKAAGSVA